MSRALLSAASRGLLLLLPRTGSSIKRGHSFCPYGGVMTEFVYFLWSCVRYRCLSLFDALVNVYCSCVKQVEATVCAHRLGQSLSQTGSTKLLRCPKAGCLFTQPLFLVTDKA